MKKEKCMVKFCRNTPETKSGLFYKGRWCCDFCWEKHCDKKINLDEVK